MQTDRRWWGTKGVIYALLGAGALFLLVACGHTVGPQRTAIATDPPPETVLATEAPPPPPHGIAAVEEAGEGTTCPDGYPIKADDTTMKYFRPDQPPYGATNARHCFASETTAQTAGYRASQG